MCHVRYTLLLYIFSTYSPLFSYSSEYEEGRFFGSGGRKGITRRTRRRPNTISLLCLRTVVVQSTVYSFYFLPDFSKTDG
jgi:hypothetical protein